MNLSKCLLAFVAAFSAFSSQAKDRACGAMFGPLNKAQFSFALSSGNWMAVRHPMFLPFAEGSDLGIQVKNFQFNFEENSLNPAAAKTVDLVLSRGAAEQMEYDRRLTNYHKWRGNSFSRSENGKKVLFTPEVNSVPMALTEANFNKVSKSMSPIMASLRSILRLFMGYSDFNKLQRLTALKEILPGLNDGELGEVFKIMSESAYREPYFEQHVMRNYPFLPIARFDGIISDPNNPRTEFFEFNAGTPSGLSNLAQLIDGLRNTDHALYSSLIADLAEDQTFSTLRHCIDSSAYAWTGRRGLIVTVGPGPLNGAHPDILNIAWLSGMPYVELKDLFIDENGDVRLHDVNQTFPLVTGIYNRREETYLTQSTELGIPLRNPYFADSNRILAERQGLKLESYIGYKTFVDPHGNPLRIETDAAHRPVLQDLMDGFGKDPRQPNGPTGAIAKSIVQRKVYVSNLGGRLVDDKRLFELISRGLQQRVQNIASPPTTLDRREILEFIREPDIKEYVVKETNKSGGDGVFILALLPDDKREEVRQKVAQNPDFYVIQRFAQLASTLVAGKDDLGNAYFQPRVVDWGVFAFQDANEPVDSQPLSILPRVAKANGLSTNTSQGAGYGLAVVVDQNGRGNNATSYVIQQEKIMYVPASIQDALFKFKNLLARRKDHNDMNEHLKLSTDLQEVLLQILPVLGRDFFPFYYQCQEFSARNMDLPTFRTVLDNWHHAIHDPNPAVVIINDHAADYLRKI